MKINMFSQELKALESFRSCDKSSNGIFKEEIISAIKKIPMEEENTER